jgi:flagellar basal-body rod protein FlgG
MTAVSIKRLTKWVESKMNHSMINSSVSMNGLMRKLDLLANNIANLNTDGFKKKEATFEDLLTSIKQQNPKQELPGRLTPLGFTMGSGARLSQVQINMAQGTLRPTENPYDVAIEGDALFEIGLPVTDENGDVTFEQAWTRNGAFRVSLIAGDSENGMLTTSDGSPVIGVDGEPVLVPNGREFVIDNQGNIITRDPSDPAAEPETVATLRLVRATRPQMLETRGENMFVLPGLINDPDQIAQLMQEIDMTLYVEGQTPIRLRQGYLEGSNVDLPAEMSELIQVQRAFQLNARALSSSDTMMNVVNNLRG